MNKTATELIFDVAQDPDGGYTANCLNEDIFTEADSWDELRSNVKDAVAAFYFDNPSPRTIRLHLVRDELLTLA